MLYLLLLILCIIQFSGAWLWPSLGFGSLDGKPLEKSFGLLLQYPLWMLIMLALINHYNKNKLAEIFTVLWPFIPFWLLGSLSAIFGYDPIASFRLLFLWLATVLAAVIISFAVSVSTLLKYLLFIFLFLLSGCILLSIFSPDYGQQLYGLDKGVWRGFFAGKNGLGWISAIALLISITSKIESLIYLRIVTLMASIVCLVMSNSVGAVFSVFAAFLYWQFLRKTPTSLNFSAKLILLMIVIIMLSIFALLGYSLLLDVIGRDATLTGRTDIWELYFNAMLNSPFLGEGPGAFTGYSPITEPLADQLKEFGGILTPHQMYLGAFGDSGLLGLLVYIFTLLYVTIILPLKIKTDIIQMVGSIGMLIIIGGFVETHEIYSSGIGWFVFILVYTQSLKIIKYPSEDQSDLIDTSH